MADADVTIVTAFFDIGRGQWQVFNRPTDLYLATFRNLASLANPMVVFTTPDLEEMVMGIRAHWGHADLTSIVTTPNFTLGYEQLVDAMRAAMERPELWQFVDRPESPEYWHYHYVLVNLMKPAFVNHAFRAGLVQTGLAAWVDFGYVRRAETLPPGPSWRASLEPGRIHAFALRPMDERPIFDIVRSGDVYIMGGVLMGDRPAWERLEPLSMEMMWTLLQSGPGRRRPDRAADGGPQRPGPVPDPPDRRLV